ncbi:TetR/AcrR family transcriptional regulator [Nonomuraea sediminis]|uniref:TetR/AcrR family transcriptional regulator n=1 Tax=Nonomuraea sediminis TaxID=2835864 RepID=UPI001BDD54D0|nr:TetR/AcrR family transcriptional regulator [Nonomuraea sediminis]
MTSASGDQSEAIMQIATRMFAAFGYDGTTLQQIAEAAGFDVATVTSLVGSKRDLYVAVMQRAHETDRRSIEEVIARFTPMSPADAPRMIHALADSYLNSCLANPHIPALWAHRSLDDAQDITDLERDYVWPLHVEVQKTIQPALDAGLIDSAPDFRYILWTLIWCVEGFAGGDVLNDEGNRMDPNDPQAQAHFREFFHLLLDRLLTPPRKAP